MVEFGKTLLSKREEDWKEYYIDYGQLKSILKLAIRARNAVVVLQEENDNNDNDEVEVGGQQNKQSSGGNGRGDHPFHNNTVLDAMVVKRGHRPHSSSFGELIDFVQSTGGPLYGKDTTVRRQNQQQQQHEEEQYEEQPSRPTTTTTVDEGYLRALEFRQALEREIEKLALFLLTEEGHLAERLYVLSKGRNELRQQVSFVMQDVWENNAIIASSSATYYGSNKRDKTGQLHPTASNNNNKNVSTHDGDSDLAVCWSNLTRLTADHRSLSEDVLRYVEFVELNVTALRKILKKHDKNFPRHPMSGTYLLRRTDVTGNNDDGEGGIGGSLLFHNSHVEQLHDHGGLSALVLTLRRAFAELHWVELNLLAVRDVTEHAAPRRHHRRANTMESSSPATEFGALEYGSTMGGSRAQQQHHHSDESESESPVRSQRPTPKVGNQSRKEMIFSGSGGSSPGNSSSSIPRPPLVPISGIASSKPPPPPPLHVPGPTTTLPPRAPSALKKHHRPTSSVGDVAATLMQIQPIHPYYCGGRGGNADMIRSSSNSSSSLIDSNPFVSLTYSGSIRRRQQQQRYQQLLLQHPTTITQRREPILDQIQAARSRLKQTTKYTELVAAQAGIFDRGGDNNQVPDEVKTPASEFNFVQRVSSFLNLCSCFLYMTNYYVVAPTVGEYAVRLGSTEAMAGIIIGMTPNAALLATFLYGWWSNHSYRHALIFAACCCAVGNICFALALYFDSLALVLVGRFLNGFGSARSINRRYIADTFSKADRTAASADFVTSGALGMAAGPAIAFVLGNVNFSNNSISTSTSSRTSLLWTNVNAPGWVMLGLWIIFLVATILFFQEPDRSDMYKDVAPDQTPLKSADQRSDYNDVPSELDCYDETRPLIVKETSSPHSQSQGGGVGPSPNLHLYGPSKPPPVVKKEPPIWKNASVMISLWLYFVLKLVLELLLSSTATVTKFYFAWTSKHTGLFMAMVALLMFPVNIGVAKLSQRYEDRQLIFGALAVMMASAVGIIDLFPGTFSVYQYVTFSVGCFVSANSLEGPNMGLLSKTIPISWAKSTFNSGFLSTEAGTLARSVGDVIISTVASTMGLQWLLKGIFIPLAILCGVSMVLVHRFYDQLIDVDDDDSTSIISGASGSTHGTNNDKQKHVSFRD